MTFLGPSSSLKCSNCAICHHHLTSLIGGHHSGNSSSFHDNNGMVLSIIELNCHPLTATIVCAIARAYMQSSRENFVCSMKWLCHDIHACSIRTNGVRALIVLFDRDRMISCLNCTCYFIQFEKVLHSSVQLRCMIFKLRTFLASGTGHPSHSLPNPNFFSQF